MCAQLCLEHCPLLNLESTDQTPTMRTARQTNTIRFPANATPESKATERRSLAAVRN